MRISLVVPAFNEEKLLPSTLASLRAAAGAFESLGWEAEFIVCDNNSTDRTTELARAAGARVVFEPVNQIARARNTGAASATGDWLVFVDADSQPSRALFEDVSQAIQSGHFIAGGATVCMDTNDLGMRFFAGLWNTLSRLRKWCAGSFIFCETAAFRAIGGFNQELYVSEELDLSERLKAHARRLGRSLVILHRHPLLTSSRKLHLYGRRTHLLFLLKAITRPRSVVRSREDCGIWYDGRR